MQTPRFSGTAVHLEKCSRCGKSVVPGDVVGKCVWEDCKGAVCRGCWHESKFRFCGEHSGSSAKRRELMQPRESDLPDVTPGLHALREARADGKEDRSVYYASEYWNWISARMEEKGPIDWTPAGVLSNPSIEKAEMGGAKCMKVTSGKWFHRKIALSLTVIPCDWSYGFDPSSVHAMVRKAARGAGGHSIVVLAGDGAPAEAADFVNRFADSSISLFLAEPRRGHLNYNIRDPAARAYSEWLGKSKEPRRFREKAASLGDLVDGRRVVSSEKMAKEFGFREKDVDFIIKSCGFLYPAGAEGKYYI